MIRRTVVGLVILAGIVAGACVAPRAEAATKRPDLNGRWRLDKELTESKRATDGMQGPGGGGGGFPGGGPPSGGGFPRGGGGGGGFPGGGPPPGGGGGAGGGQGGPPDRDGSGSGRGGREGGGPPASPLPEVVQVTQTEQALSFAEPDGTVKQEIALPTSAPGTVAHVAGARVFQGKWKGKKLEARFADPRGMKLTQTLALTERGEVLVVSSKRSSSGGMPSSEEKVYYRRVLPQ